jgi:hypothetical protein
MAEKKLDHRRYYKDKKGKIIAYYDVWYSTFGALAIMIADICLLTVFIHFGNTFLAIASVGIVTFVGVLALADYVSIEPSVSTGEMRSAITASIMVLYLVFVAYAFTGGAVPSTDLASTAIQNFTYVAGIVVIFYFGSKAVLQYVEAKDQANNSRKTKKEKKT